MATENEKYPRRVKHSGVAFEFGENTLVVPPLTAGQVEGLTPALIEHDALKVGTFDEVAKRLRMRLPVIGAALRRNYPEFTEADLEEFVNMENSIALLQAALGQSAEKKTRDVGESEPVKAL